MQDDAVVDVNTEQIPICPYIMFAFTLTYQNKTCYTYNGVTLKITFFSRGLY